MEKKILIVADDLTGAQDTAIQLRNCGGSVKVALTLDYLKDNWDSGDVWALNTETRLLNPRDASAKLTELLNSLNGKHYTLYKKVDSTLRGNLGAEIEAVLRASGKTAAVVAPSLPAGGRIVVDGTAFVHGVPLHESECGRDPFTPVFSSDVREILGAQTSLDVVGIRLPDIRKGPAYLAATFFGATAARPTIYVCDAETDEDLAALAFLRDRQDVLFVGSSGLAALFHDAVDVAEGPEDLPFLAMVGSLNSVSQSQADAFAAALDPFVLQVDGERAVSDVTSERRRVAARIAEAGDLAGRHVLIRCTARPVGGAASNGVLVGIGRAIAKTISEITLDVLGGLPRRNLFVTGGDLCSVFLDLSGASGIQLIDESEPGVPRGIVIGGRLDGYCLFSKAGGFGDGQMLCRLAERKKH